MSIKEFEDKAIKSKKSKKKTTKTKKSKKKGKKKKKLFNFYFPKYQRSVKASSIKEAEKKLKKSNK